MSRNGRGRRHGEALECSVPVGVVGGVVLPAFPDDVGPGSADDPHGVGVVVPPVAGLGVEVFGPGVAAPGVAGLIDAADVALEFYYAGLWWVHPDGRVEVRRKATIQKYPEPLPQQLIQSLAYRAARVAAIDAGLAEVETAEATQCADQRSEATPTC